MHEPNCDMGCFLTKQVCLDMAERYEKDLEECSKYLNGTMTLDELCIQLDAVQLVDHLEPTCAYLPPYIIHISLASGL